MQLLDSNLRSLGYLCENKHFYTPYYNNGSWRAQSKDDNLIFYSCRTFFFDAIVRQAENFFPGKTCFVIKK